VQHKHKKYALIKLPQLIALKQVTANLIVRQDQGELSDEAFAEAAGVMLNEQHQTRAKTHAVR